VLITDAQVHVWQEETPERPWPPGGRERAHRPGSLTAEDVLRDMDSAGVERAVLVPPSFEGDRNDLCLRAARAYPDRFAVMGRISPEESVGGPALRRWREQPGMLGVRLTLSRGQAQQWLATHTLDWLWAGAQELAIPIYVLPPDLLDQIRIVAREHPELKLIIDHLGLRTGLRDAEIRPGINDILGLADLPNIAVKASCLPSYVSEDYPFPALQKIIERVVTAYGARRVFWGSDLSRLPCTYQEALNLFTKELDFLAADDLEWILGRGVSEWLGWPS
jgi:L-fuconolactonase